jgi:guanine nucleotide-binding protein subunit alpha
MSTNTEELEQKKKSQAIDRVLEEDSKRLRKECKILLLGEFAPTSPTTFHF